MLKPKFNLRNNPAYKEGSILGSTDVGTKIAPVSLTFTRASKGYIEKASGLVEMDSNIPRIDKDGNTLYEPARTNLLTYSQDFSNASWTKFAGGTGIAPVVTPNIEIAPDGTLTADRVVFDSGVGVTSSDRSLLSVVISVTSGVPYTTSVYLKGSVGGEQISIPNARGVYSTITLTTSWQKFTLTETTSTTSSNLQFGIRQAVDGTIKSTATIYIWGAQFEQGSYPSSYIPTTSATATRVADSASLTGLKAAGLIGVSAGTIGGEFTASSLVRDSTTFNVYLGFSEYFAIRRTSTGIAERLIFHSNLTGLIYVPTQDYNKWLFAWNSSGWFLSVNGAVVASGVDVFTFPTDNLSLNGAGGKWGLGKLYSYTTKLTEAEANNLTK